MNSTPVPLIFDIHRFALDDGPGIRTTVFFKGCPLNCIWCHNPESQTPRPEISFRSELCMGCGECKKVCPLGAIRFSGNDGLSEERIQRQLCDACGYCATQCPSMAIRCFGKEYNEDELLVELLHDQLFFENSGGGVTFSGGEPTVYMDFLASLLPRLRQHGVHITLQTCGYFDFNRFRNLLLPHLDLIHFDLKLADPAQHRRYTGRDNSTIIGNFRKLAAEAKARLVARLPLVPGITADLRNLSAFAVLLSEVDLPRIQLLPYHPGGLTKLRSLGRVPNAALPDTMLGAEEEKHWQEIMDGLMRKVT